MYITQKTCTSSTKLYLCMCPSDALRPIQILALWTDVEQKFCYSYIKIFDIGVPVHKHKCMLIYLKSKAIVSTYPKYQTCTLLQKISSKFEFSIFPFTCYSNPIHTRMILTFYIAVTMDTQTCLQLRHSAAKHNLSLLHNAWGYKTCWGGIPPLHLVPGTDNTLIDVYSSVITFV